MIYVLGNKIDGKIKSWYYGRGDSREVILTEDLSKAAMLHIASIASEIARSLNEEGYDIVIQSFQNSDQMKFVLDIYNENKVKDLEISALKMNIEALKGEKAELIKRYNKLKKGDEDIDAT